MSNFSAILLHTLLFARILASETIRLLVELHTMGIERVPSVFTIILATNSFEAVRSMRKLVFVVMVLFDDKYVCAMAGSA